MLPHCVGSVHLPHYTDSFEPKAAGGRLAADYWLQACTCIVDKIGILAVI